MPDLWGCLSNDSGERRWERTRSAFTASQCGGTPVSFDVAVRGGTIVDGTGLPATWPTSACGKGGSSDQGLLEAAVWPVAHVWPEGDRCEGRKRPRARGEHGART